MNSNKLSTILLCYLIHRRLCAEAKLLTELHKNNVDRRLTDRICDVTYWREELDIRHDTLMEDAANLRVIRDRLLKQYELYLRPLQISNECIEIR